jgi:hypothetical protein
MTGANFSSWFRADEGTVYAEATSPNVTENRAFYPYVISDGTNSNYLGVHRGFAGSTNRFVSIIQINNSTSQGMFNNAVNWDPNSLAKIAFGFKFNDVAGVYNSGNTVTDTETLVPVVNRINIGANPAGTGSFFNSHIRKLAYYPKRLTNAQLQAITG